ncbi:ABC transporter ATP-binding protein [Mumia sp. zg.B53]|uniref:ABC transporter ATP-binding protein n=1 Tax=unclassified Mumia TaxID=2621872 RepID=UPI001C6DEEB8|nr:MULTISPECIES: ABC transporter ATP-binding protein [unclassified Mumia]MBW9215425.1 ABC transporter ATP-binding protein [Mumia sp. zg.B53]MDD9349025.1 ABC transporter ATP-binding protein [Mumia sp.]
MTEKGLDARLVLRRGALTIDVTLQVAPGEVLALVGPNGAGKSSVLRALAGLSDLDSGRVALGGTVLEDTATGVRVPTPERDLTMVFQDPLLFPHLTVRDNVAFGLRHHPSAPSTSRRPARERATAALERSGLAQFAGRRATRLSGGQRQRVAIVRALACDPGLLLLDEPTSALDVAVTAQVRAFLRRHVRDFGGVTVLVSHDPLDAFVLADRVAVLEEGRITQAGTPDEVARRPRTDYVAHLMGMNLLRERDTFRTFSPTAVTLYGEEPVTSARNVWRLEVTGLVPHGDAVRVQLRGEVSLLADVTRAAVADLDLHEGVSVWASVKATEVTTFED